MAGIVAVISECAVLAGYLRQRRQDFTVWHVSGHCSNLLWFANGGAAGQPGNSDHGRNGNEFVFHRHFKCCFKYLAV
jgi:hypothetical protein